jgi:hypothetical protein
MTYLDIMHLSAGIMIATMIALIIPVIACLWIDARRRVRRGR